MVKLGVISVVVVNEIIFLLITTFSKNNFSVKRDDRVFRSGEKCLARYAKIITFKMHY